MEETSGRATEEDPSSRTDGHAIDVACTEKSNNSLMLSEWIQETTEQDEASPSGAQARRPPVHHDDLEEGRPHKIISNRQREASMLTEI